MARSLLQRYGIILISTATSLVFLCSCGKAPPKPQPVQTEAESNSATSVSEVQPPLNSSAEITELTEIAAVDPKGLGDEQPVNPTSNSGSQEGLRGQTAPSTPNIAVDAAPAVPSPTATQLENWKIVEWEPWHLLARQPTKSQSFVSCSAASSDGKWLVLGGDKLTLWQTGSDSPVAILWEMPNAPENTSIVSVAIAPNNQWLAAGDSNGFLKTWNLSTYAEIASKKIYSTGVVQIAIADEGQEIATTTYQNEVSVWNAKNLEPKKKFDANGYTKLCYVGSEQLVVTGETMELWNPTTGKMTETIIDKGYPKSISRSDDRMWYAVANDEELKLIHADDPQQSRSIQSNFATNELLEFSQDGKLLWSANGAMVRAWDLTNGTTLQAIDTWGPSIVGIDYLPQERLLRIVTEDGTIKLWGTIAAGEASGLKPLHASVVLPNRTSPQLATAAQLLEAIDLRSFPRPPKSQMQTGESAMVTFETPEPADEIKSFYRYLLHQRGWTERPGNALTPDYLFFEKGSVRLFISVYVNQPSVTSVQIANLGNANAAMIPKLDVAEPKVIYEDSSSTTYLVKTDLLTAEVQLLKKLHADGWIPYSRLNASDSEEKESRDLEFINHAITLRVTVRPAIDDPTNLMIQYSLFVAQSNFPVPNDCDYLECDAGSSPAMVAFTSLDLNACQEFFDRAMPDNGWLAAGSTESQKQDIRWLTYFRGQQEITLRLSREADGRTCIRTGEHAEQNSWQLAKVDTPTDTDVTSGVNQTGIEAAEMPIYKASEANSVKYETKFKQIEVEIPKTSHIEIVDHYAKTMRDQGWKEEPNGIREEDYAFVTFTKNETSIELRVNTSKSLNTTTYSLSDDGILWNKPLPERNELVSYETWLRKHHHPATLRLLDTFMQEMQAAM